MFQSDTSTIIVTIIVFSLLSGCAPIYHQSSPNIPMLSEQGDAKVSLRGGFSGIELQGAYASADRLYFFGGVMGSEDESNDGLETSRHRYAEIGAGTMWRPVQNIIFEGAGGLGFGSGTGTALITIGQSSIDLHSEGRYIKPFLQGNIAFQSRAFDIGIVNRLSLIRFNEIREIGSSPAVISDPTSPIFWEPSLFIQAGWDRIKFNFNTGLTGPVIGKPDFDYNMMNVSFGISYQFNVN
jgi:hypothetical protein